MFEFNTGSDTDFEWHVGGDPNTPFSLLEGGPSGSFTAKVAAFVLYEGSGAPPIPEPGSLASQPNPLRIID